MVIPIHTIVVKSSTAVQFVLNVRVSPNPSVVL